MGKGYTPVQNTEMFKMFDSIVGSGEAFYHTVGSLFGGRKVWLLAKFNGEVKLDDGDVLDKYVLLSNAHDGSGALTAMFTPVRVVCWNTLSVALRGGNQEDSKRMYLRHTQGITEKAIDVRKYLGLENLYYERMMEECNSLIQKSFTKEQMAELSLQLYRGNEEIENIEDIKGTSRSSVEQTISLFNHGIGTNGENAYDAFNAVTEDDSVREKRLNQTWFGKGQSVREKTFNILSADNYDELLKPRNENLIADLAGSVNN